MKKKSAKVKATTQKLQDRLPLQLLWSLDLATVEQRMNASALHWDIVPPSVQYLNYVGQNRLLVGTHQHLQLIDASSGQSDLDLVHNDAWYSGMLSTLLTTDNGLFVMADMEHTVVRTIETGEVVFECRHSHRVASTAISADGQRLSVLRWDGILQVYDVESGAELFQLKHDPPKKPEDGCCVLGPNGLRAASSWKGSVCFWDLESGVLIRKHRNKNAGVRFTPDGLRALTRGGTGYVLWDLETGKKISGISGATEHVLSEEIISPTNSLVAKVAPFKLHNQQGEVCSVRKWLADDMPFAETQLVNYAWYGDDRLATW